MDFIRYLSEKHGIYLNEQQQKAVVNIQGPTLLLAVPGAGKTTVIVSRCANMVLNHKIDPGKILTLTFSKASVIDMKNRFHKIFGDEAGKGLNFSTIHSFCFNILKTWSRDLGGNFPIIIESDRSPITKNQLLRQIFYKHNNIYINDDKLEELSNKICYIKNMMLSNDEIENQITNIKNFFKIYKSYEEYKLRNNYIDFDDMLARTLNLLLENKEIAEMYRNKYEYINVDESQDTSYLQHQIIRQLAIPKNNIFMVGDEDQSIYAFRGAFPKALMDFKKTYPGASVLLMEKNYRSTLNIIAAANKLIKQNDERYNKTMFSERGPGAPVKYKCLQERIQQYPYIVSLLKQQENLSGTAVLYRNNVSAISLAYELHARGIPFYLHEYKANFFRHWIIIDIIRFMEFSLDQANVKAFREIYYKMNIFISKAMADYAIENSNTGRNFFDILLGYPGNTEMKNIRLLETKHNIIKLSRMKPEEAIDFIMNELGYGNYIIRQNHNSSDELNSLMLYISELKYIALKTRSIKEFKDNLAILKEVMDNSKHNREKNAVTLSTIHSSKGLEFDKVYIIDLFDGILPSSESINNFILGDKTLIQEEVRLFYVGITRAKHYLELIAANKLEGKPVKPSRFIEQLFFEDNSLSSMSSVGNLYFPTEQG
ncbi:MAG TPA: ATP-dependent helicase [Clostridiaceae bacterium]|nr:ATP-dependent helicase [Clostridiaceae bacterium]